MIKTVKCPECGAEQVIFRDENGEVHCAFCSCLITDLPPVSEDEGFPENDSEDGGIKTPPVGEAVSSEFILNSEEVEKALLLSGKLRSRKYIVWIETGLLALFVIVMLISVLAGYMGWWNMAKPDSQTYFIIILAAALIPFVWIMPKRNKKRIIENATSGKKICVEVYENLAEVGVEDMQKWQLVFEEGFNFINQDGIIVIIMKNGQILAIPERGFKEEELQEAKDRIITGYKTV